jgi:hypothetical protein
MDVPPASGFENDGLVRRWMLAGKPTRDRLDFIGDVGELDVTDCVFAMSTGILSIETSLALCC